MTLIGMLSPAVPTRLDDGAGLGDHSAVHTPTGGFQTYSDTVVPTSPPQPQQQQPPPPPLPTAPGAPPKPSHQPPTEVSWRPDPSDRVNPTRVSQK